MNQAIVELIRSVERLYRKIDSDDLDRREIVYHLRKIFDQAMREISPRDAYPYLGTEAAESIHRHLDVLEARLESFARTSGSCAQRTESMLGRFPQMLTALDDIKAASSGYQNFIEDFRDFFTLKTAVVVDPYIFANGSEVEADYCKHVLEIIGPHPERVDFYFRIDRYKKSIADTIFNALQVSNRTVNFFECTNMHDRVWMSHYMTTDNPPKTGWKARVVGSSVNGIALRPTYVVDMQPKDAQEYSKYLGKLRAQGKTHTSPPSEPPPVAPTAPQK